MVYFPPFLLGRTILCQKMCIFNFKNITNSIDLQQSFFCCFFQHYKLVAPGKKKYRFINILCKYTNAFIKVNFLQS